MVLRSSKAIKLGEGTESGSGETFDTDVRRDPSEPTGS